MGTEHFSRRHKRLLWRLLFGAPGMQQLVMPFGNGLPMQVLHRRKRILLTEPFKQRASSAQPHHIERLHFLLRVVLQ